MNCKFNGMLELRKGEIVKILRGSQGSPLGVTTIENLTTGKTHRSRIEGVIAAFPPITFPDPIIGKVVSSNVSEYNTEFVIEPGTMEDHVFVRPGEKQKGTDAIINIFKSQLHTYVKICDPYISPDTIMLISEIPSNIEILILTDKVTDEARIKAEIASLKNKLIIKRGLKLHDRFVLTRGEGWNIGHSLKDFGTRYSQLSKMVSSLDAENAFDESWNLSTDVMDNRNKFSI